MACRVVSSCSGRRDRPARSPAVVLDEMIGLYGALPGHSVASAATEQYREAVQERPAAPAAARTGQIEMSANTPESAEAGTQIRHRPNTYHGFCFTPLLET